MAFTNSEQQEISAHGLSLERAAGQLHRFQEGFSCIRPDRPCVPGDGIRQLDPDERNRWVALFEKEALQRQIMKFVPASGAATRMLKSLFQFAESEGTLRNAEVDLFLAQRDDFAFGAALRRSVVGEQTDLAVVQALLNKGGLGFAGMPKGLIPFHRYGDQAVTAMEEHIAEGERIAPGRMAFHFTISEDHAEAVSALFRHCGAREASFSCQDKKTDTLAVDSNNRPYRDKSGRLVFRPAGHGALIENLSRLEADVIFIKNIDNITHRDHWEKQLTYKKALGGLLLHLQTRIFESLAVLENHPTEAQVQEIAEFLNRELAMETPAKAHTGFEARCAALRAKLARPIRVCGMVRNEGEPGGGPFWTANGRGELSPQIIEKAQLDQEDPHTQEALAASTHFNPVDLVVATRKPDGSPYDLHAFSNPETGFISEKTHQGDAIRALELPGLWNGAMADWITVFVEVPLDTFHPVKVITDLLKPGHRPVNKANLQ